MKTAMKSKNNIIDPVCLMKIDSRKTDLRYDYKSQTYYFCAEGCRKTFESNPEKYRVVALAAGRNIDLLMEQAKKFHPIAVAAIEKDLEDLLRDRLKNSGTEVFSGREGFIYLATLKQADTVISAMTGAAGLVPTYEAIKAGKDIALANKETMVMAGPLVMYQAKKQGVSILPIDS